MKVLGELFLHCGSKQIAGPNSNLENGAGENFSLAYRLDWHLEPMSSSNIENVCSTMTIKLPAYEPLIASVFNVVYSGEFFRTAFSQKIDVKLSKTLSILTLPKYTSEGVL